MSSASYWYMASPIDAARPEVATKRALIQRRLTARGISFFAPDRAWNLVDPHPTLASTLDRVNTQAILDSSGMIALLDGPSVGVPVELQIAKSCGIPTVVVTDDPRPLMLQVLATCGVHTNVESAIDALEIEAKQERATVRLPRVTLVARNDCAREFPLPKQSKPGDIGLDLYVSREVTIPPGEYRGVPSDIHVAPPADVWFMICGRSSALHRRGLMVVQSVIDSGFRGELFAMAYNITDAPVTVQPGERLAQLLPLPVTPMVCAETRILPDSERGTTGFGSTGA